jgi:two-component system OmpR family response regulator/two-component system copper resistance phosphate regulon response regulator CusR
MELLLAEDDVRLGKSLKRGLIDSGHACRWTRSGRQALELALSQQFDAVILDLMLPELGGLEVLARLRAEHVQTPVIVLTALGDVDDRVRGLDAGADDYLGKPFAFAELLARLGSLARRAGPKPGPVLSVGPLRLDLATRRVRRDGVDVPLSPTEFSLLELLMRHAGQVVTRRMFCQHVWDADWEGLSNVVDVNIKRLRSKIDRGFPQSLIHTIRGRGYVLRPSGGDG